MTTSSVLTTSTEIASASAQPSTATAAETANRPTSAAAVDAAQERRQRDDRQGAGQERQDRHQPREQLAQHDLGVGEVRGRHLRQDAPGAVLAERPAVAAGATSSTIASWMPASA